MAKKKSTRPALVIDCGRTDDHDKHHWVPEEGKSWPEGTFWHCRGRNSTEIAEGLRETAKAIKKNRKNR